MPTIPISQIVDVIPGVVSGGGAASLLTGVVLSQDASVPADQVLTFFDAADVSTWFGPAAPETLIANNYFPGIVNGGQLPAQLQFARDNLAASGAEVFGAQLGALTLTQLQALSGTLIVTTAALHTSSAISLTAASSFANAASLMQAGFTSPDFTITYDSVRNRFLLTVTATGPSSSVSAVTGTLADGVGLSSASGAHVQTAGYAVDTPATAMARLITSTTNFGTFTTAWVPTISDRLAFAQWNSGQNYQYLYVSADVEAASLVVNNASSFGAQVFAAPYQGTIPLYGGVDFAGAIMGYAASINFNITNGRTDGAFRQFNSGLAATVNTLANANALLSNSYTYYGAYANAANNYTIVYAGAVSGAFLWIDTYLDQIYLNRELQRALFEALLAYNSLPYNQDGYTALYRAGADVATAALTSGIIRAGVTLSGSQQQLVNSQAGRVIAPAISNTGWYLLIGDPANVAQARQNRTSPDAQFWYADGGSIQQITLQSRAVI
jgi:hypothetical protein